MTTGEKIKNLRKSLNMTQDEFARTILVSRRTVLDWEHDRYSPQTENLKEICKIFNLDLNYFIDSDNTILEATNSSNLDDIVDNSINIDQNKENVNLDEFKALKSNIVITGEDKLKYRKTIFKNNRIFNYYIPFLYLAWIVPIALGFTLAWYDADDLYFNLVIIIPLVFYLLYRYLKNRYIDKTLKVMKDSVNSDRTLLSFDYPLFYDTKDRLKIYDKDRLVYDVDGSEIKKVVLYLNNIMYNGVLPIADKKLYGISMYIYYKDGNKNIITIEFPMDKKVHRLISTFNKNLVINGFNKIYIKYNE